MEMFTHAQLTEALKKVRLWYHDPYDQEMAHRSTILHPEDAANDIILSIRLTRAAEEDTPGG